jgi:N utilization substance protein A
MLGRVIVLVREDQLSLAIGKKGQNVRLASKLVGWDIEVMTQEELDDQLERSVAALSQIPRVTDELAESLVSQGFFSFYDLSVIEPDHLQQLSGLSPAECDEIVAYAEREAEKEEAETERRKALEREAKRVEREAAELDAMTGTSLDGTAEPAAQDAEAQADPEPQATSGENVMDDTQSETDDAQGEVDDSLGEEEPPSKEAG